eukprot:TRINITY_DN18260_c0_g1_i1.p1 TRINITY_DN18260_c0_g1~~TRINITY_DN18260_c0_g1_i1.p1  ORF type:complete len:214 (-),score=43.93 TRINITY_DN18260_c0_g1_i1:36-677(-)
MEKRQEAFVKGTPFKIVNPTNQIEVSALPEHFRKLLTPTPTPSTTLSRTPTKQLQLNFGSFLRTPTAMSPKNNPGTKTMGARSPVSSPKFYDSVKEMNVSEAKNLIFSVRDEDKRKQLTSTFIQSVDRALREHEINHQKRERERKEREAEMRQSRQKSSREKFYSKIKVPTQYKHLTTSVKDFIFYNGIAQNDKAQKQPETCLLYTSPSPRDS